MTAVDDLLVQAFSMSGPVASMLEAAMEAHKALAGAMLLYIEPSFPVPEEEREKEKDASINFSPVIEVEAIYAPMSAVKESLERFESQTGLIASVFSGMESSSFIREDASTVNATQGYKESLREKETSSSGLEAIERSISDSRSERISASSYSVEAAFSEISGMESAGMMIKELESIRDSISMESVSETSAGHSVEATSTSFVSDGMTALSEIYAKESASSTSMSIKGRPPVRVTEERNVSLQPFMPALNNAGSPSKEATENIERLSEAIIEKEAVEKEALREELEHTAATFSIEPAVVSAIGMALNNIATFRSVSQDALKETFEASIMSDSALESAYLAEKALPFMREAAEIIFQSAYGGQQLISSVSVIGDSLTVGGSHAMVPVSSDMFMPQVPGGAIVENIMQTIYGSTHNSRDAISQSPVTFNNTFNITVTVKGGEEKEMKELGRKIGVILSEELKRYGGLR